MCRCRVEKYGCGRDGRRVESETRGAFLWAGVVLCLSKEEFRHIEIAGMGEMGDRAAREKGICCKLRKHVNVTRN
jgi:hypothetical protein